jgi:hypothetical protein
MLGGQFRAQLFSTEAHFRPRVAGKKENAELATPNAVGLRRGELI